MRSIPFRGGIGAGIAGMMVEAGMKLTSMID